MRRDLPHNAVILQLGDLGSLEGVFAERIANDVLCRSLLESLDEFIVDIFLDVDSRSRTAALSVIEEDSKIDPRDRVINIRVLEHDVRAFATKLEGHLLKIRTSSGLHDLTAYNSAAGEGHLINVHVRGKSGASDLAKAREDVDDAWREASFFYQLGRI